MQLPEHIQNILNQYDLLPPGTQLIVGVSGGADSVALLHAIHHLGLNFTVAHMNHQLRGAESDADEQFVRSLGFPTVVKSVDVRAWAEEQQVSIEMAARQARHAFFSEFDNAVVALAHHADDQVETFFLKLARGAGTKGLGGMAVHQEIDGLNIIRPMLDLSQVEIRNWLEQHGFAWREDASNSDSAYLRNRVRHTILPMLEQELNPNLRKTILRTMNILREENSWMDSMADLSADSTAAKRRALREWLFAQGAKEAGFDAVSQILTQIDAAEGTTVFELNANQRVVVEYGVPRFEHQTTPMPATPFRISIEPGTGWRKDRAEAPGILPAEASFNAEKIGPSPIEVRTWQPGDRMRPMGMEGHRKLQDIFTDLKIPQQQRARIPVVVCRGEVIWLPGYRIARDWAVPTPAGKAMHVRIEQIETE